KKIALHEIEVAWPNLSHETTVTTADDLFNCVAAGQDASQHPIPETGTLRRAIFHVKFADSATPRPVEIVPPHTIKVSQPADAQAIEPWLIKSGFCRTIADYDFTI